MKAPDLNDRLRAGTLPVFFADAVPMGNVQALRPNVEPHSPDAERAAVAHLLVAAPVDVRAWFTRLSADDFYVPGHRVIVEAAASLVAAGVEAPDHAAVRTALSTSGRLVEAEDDLERVRCLAPSGALEVHAAAVVELAAVRRTAAACRDVLKKLRHPTGDRGALLASARDSVARASTVRTRGTLGVTPATLAEAKSKSIAEGVTHAGLPTGIRAFDDLFTLGGLEPERVYACVARPGRGKTAFALSVALNVAEQGGGVGFFLTEGSASELFNRAISIVSRVPSGRVISQQFGPNECTRVLDAMLRFEAMPIRVFDDASMTADHVAVCAEALRDEWDRTDGPPLSLLVVDYAQNLTRRPGASRESDRVEIVRDVRRLERLAQTLRVPILLPTQGGRELDKLEQTSGWPTMAHIADASEIEKATDAVFFLTRPKGAPDAGPDDIAPMLCTVVKNRMGVGFGQTVLGFHPSTMTYSDYRGVFSPSR